MSLLCGRCTGGWTNRGKTETGCRPLGYLSGRMWCDQRWCKWRNSSKQAWDVVRRSEIDATVSVDWGRIKKRGIFLHRSGSNNASIGWGGKSRPSHVLGSARSHPVRKEIMNSAPTFCLSSQQFEKSLPIANTFWGLCWLPGGEKRPLHTEMPRVEP